MATPPPPPPLTSGVTGLFNNASLLLSNAAPVAATTLVSTLPARRPHRRVRTDGEEAMPQSAAYSAIVNEMQQEASVAVQDMALRGELSLGNVTEQQLEEWEVDQTLQQEAVAKLKQRLSIKIREQESLAARIRVARAQMQAKKKREKEQRMATLRIQRAALMRQQSEDRETGLPGFSARAPPPTDLTTEGIEPNPSVHKHEQRCTIIMKSSLLPTVDLIVCVRCWSSRMAL